MSSAERMRSHGNPARLAMLVKRATLPLENVEMMYRSFKSVSPGTESGQGSRRCHALFRWSFSSWVSSSMPNSSRSSSSDVRWRASRFVQGISPRRTRSIDGLYLPRQASAKAAQSTLKFFCLPSSSPSRITEPRQSTTVPNTSKTRAFTPKTSTLDDLLACHAPPGTFQHGPSVGVCAEPDEFLQDTQKSKRKGGQRSGTNRTGGATARPRSLLRGYPQTASLCVKSAFGGRA